jgi:ABC-type uncharacterized transport system substrate-binding protein
MGYSVDPVGNGFVASLARPGGNITGLSSSQDDATPKQVELLTITVPNLLRVALLANPDSPNFDPVLKNVRAAAKEIGLVLVPVEMRSPQEVPSAFATMARERVGAVMVIHVRRRKAGTRNLVLSARACVRAETDSFEMRVHGAEKSFRNSAEICARYKRTNG